MEDWTIILIVLIFVIFIIISIVIVYKKYHRKHLDLPLPLNRKDYSYVESEDIKSPWQALIKEMRKQSDETHRQIQQNA